MGSYQPTVPHGPSEYFLRALHRIFPSVTTLDRDTFIQTKEKREKNSTRGNQSKFSDNWKSKR